MKIFIRLPSDNMSTENATILTNSVKWPLMIDPQLQGRHSVLLPNPYFNLNFFC